MHRNFLGNPVFSLEKTRISLFLYGVCLWWVKKHGSPGLLVSKKHGIPISSHGNPNKKSVNFPEILMDIGKFSGNPDQNYV